MVGNDQSAHPAGKAIHVGFTRDTKMFPRVVDASSSGSSCEVAEVVVATVVVAAAVIIILIYSISAIK